MYSKNPQTRTQTAAKPSILQTHTVLRNTYFLLSLTLLFSALMSWVAIATNAPYPGILLTLIGMFGLMFLTMKLKNSVWGLASIFAFTGFIGFTMGPFINAFLHTYQNGGQLVMTALGGTGLIFFALSGYVLVSRKNFNFMGGFLTVGLVIALVAIVANIFLKMPGLQLAISGALVIVFSGFILYDTSRIINNGETNYIMATIALYLDIVNLFQNLLILLSAFSGNRN